MKQTLFAVVLVSLVAGAGHAQSTKEPDSQRMDQPSAKDAQATTMTAGEIRKIDKAQGKVTISHEPIKNLDMPKMTMVFRVAKLAMLDEVKPGDKVRFVADKVDGNLTVVRWETVK